MQDIDDSRKEWILDALQRFEGPLVRYAANILGDVDQARDVVQDAFLRLWTADREQVQACLPAWLYTVCRNRALDMMRKERRMVPLDNIEVDACSTALSPARAQAETNERRERVADALSVLPYHQREVIRLKFQDALSYKEISQITGLSVSNVGYLIHVGVKTIRARLAEQVGTVTASQGATP